VFVQSWYDMKRPKTTSIGTYWAAVWAAINDFGQQFSSTFAFAKSYQLSAGG